MSARATPVATASSRRTFLGAVAACRLLLLGVALQPRAVGALRTADFGDIRIADGARPTSLRRHLGAGPSSRRAAALGLRVRLPEELVRCILEFLPQPAQVVSLLGAAPATLWRRGEALRTFAPGRHATRVVDVKFFPAGDKLVTALSDGTATVWNATSRRALHTFVPNSPTKKLFDIEVFPDGDKVLTLSKGAGATIWSASSGSVLQHLRRPMSVDDYRVARIFPGGDRIVTGVTDFALQPAIIWSVGGDVVHELWQRDGGRIRHLEMSPCGRKLVTAGIDVTYLWDADTGELQSEMLAETRMFPGVAVGEGGATVVIGSFDPTRLLIWDGPTGSLRSSLNTGASVIGFVLLSGGERLLVCGEFKATIWNLEVGKQVRELPGIGGPGLRHIAASADGNVVAACGARPWGETRTIVWDVAAGRRVRTIWGGRGRARSSEPRCRVAVGPLAATSLPPAVV